MKDNTKIKFNLEMDKDGILFLQYRIDYSESKLWGFIVKFLEKFNYWRTPHYFKFVNITSVTSYDDCLKRITFDTVSDYYKWLETHNFKTFGEFYSHYWNERTINEYNVWLRRLSLH